MEYHDKNQRRSILLYLKKELIAELKENKELTGIPMNRQVELALMNRKVDAPIVEEILKGGKQ